MKAIARHAAPKLASRIRRAAGAPLKVIGIGELDVSTRTSDVFVAYALGSCVALTLHDPVARVGGMMHCPLPSSDIDRERARLRPGMFVDTAVTRLLRMMDRAGAVKERLVARAAGAGIPFNDHGLFQIGKRNYAALRKVLWKNDMVLSGTLVGGRAPRTVFHLVDVGETLVRMEGEVLAL